MELRVSVVLSIVSGVLWLTMGSEAVPAPVEDTGQNQYRVTDTSTNAPCDPLNPTDVSFISCDGLQDALFQDPSATNCSQFFRCSQSKRVNCSCGPQMVFNAVTQTCIVGEQLATPCLGTSYFYPGLCGDKGDNFYPVPDSHTCDRYFECRGGKYRDHLCTDGATFDKASGGCRPPSPHRQCSVTTELDDDYDSGVANAGQDECFEQPDGKYAVHRGLEPRTQFYVCAGGLKMAQGSCLEGQSFVVELQRCVAPTIEQVTTSEESTKEPNDDDCSHLNDGYHPDLSRQCRRFYLCRSGQRLLEMTCPEGTHFDSRTQRCTSAPATSECTVPAAELDVTVTVKPGECADRPDGYHPSPGSGCLRFVSCQGGQATSELTCPVGQAFDEVRGRCLLEHKVHCHDPLQESTIAARSGATVAKLEEVDPQCHGKSDDYYPDFSTACHRFIYCQNGHKTAQLSCHVGQIFDQKTKSCQPSAVGGECTGLIELHKESENEEEENDDDTRCQGKPDGYYGDVGRQCRRFHYCSDERVTTQLMCAQGQAFDDGARECLPQGQVDCRAAQMTSGAQMSTSNDGPCPQMDSGGDDGFHPDYARGCRRYVHCRNGSRVAEYLCTLGQLFDPIARRCLPRALVHCSAPPPGPPRDAACRWWDDGYYPSWDDGCRTYYYCRNGLKIVDLACPSGQRFDSREKFCMDEKAAGPCDQDVGTTELGRCTGQLDGAQPDLEEPDGSNCSSRYYVCRGGSHQGSFQCPMNHCFDEKSKHCKQQHSGMQQDCQHRPDGTYGDLRAQCALYFLCRSGVRVGGGRCSPGQRFHSIRQMCLPQQRVPCTWPKSTPPTTSTMTTTTKTMTTKHPDNVAGFHFLFEGGCSHSTLCFESKQSFVQHCGHTLSFSQTGGMADCQVSSIGMPSQGMAVDEVAPITWSQLTNENHFDCSTREDGHYVDATSQCRRWHVCSNGLSSSYQCPAGSVFDLLHRRCSDADTVDCSAAQRWVHRNHSEETMASPCHARDNGIYVDLSGGSNNNLPLGSTCFPVHLCLGGQVYGINCPKSTNRATTKSGFDNCDPSDAHRCIPRQPVPGQGMGDISFLFNCSGRSDGYYLAPGQGCHVFHRCVGGHKFSHYCPPGQLFSFEAQGCDVQENVKCLEATQVVQSGSNNKTSAGDVT